MLMTQIGHILVGATVGVLCKPQRISSKWLAVYLGAFILLANVPDLPFRNWGHDRYEASHSIFVSLLFIAVMVGILVLWRDTRDKVGGWGVLIGGAVAWLSHLLLDSFYNHGHGIAIYWPFSDERLILPIPWFSVVTEVDYFTAEGFREYLTEFVFFTPFLVAVLLWIVTKAHWRQSAGAK